MSQMLNHPAHGRIPRSSRNRSWLLGLLLVAATLLAYQPAWSGKTSGMIMRT